MLNSEGWRRLAVTDVRRRLFPVIMTRYKSPVYLGCLASITEYLVSGGDQIIAVFFIPSPPLSSPRTQQPIISKS